MSNFYVGFLSQILINVSSFLFKHQTVVKFYSSKCDFF